MVSSNNETTPCVMLITFERAWTVGRFDAGCGIFVVPQKPRVGPVAHRRCFGDISGRTDPRCAQKRQICTRRRDIANLVETAGHIIALACQKGILARTRYEINLVYPLNTREKQTKKLYMVRRCPGSSRNSAKFDVESI